MVENFVVNRRLRVIHSSAPWLVKCGSGLSGAIEAATLENYVATESERFDDSSSRLILRPAGVMEAVNILVTETNGVVAEIALPSNRLFRFIYGYFDPEEVIGISLRASGAKLIASYNAVFAGGVSTMEITLYSTVLPSEDSLIWDLV